MNRLDTVKKVRGIYKVTNKINGKVYIGQSVDIGRRWREHMTVKDDIYFHKAIQKYGVENFKWEVIEKCKKKDLDEREIYWIEYYDSFNKGYNCTKGGDGNSGEGNPNWKGGVSSDEDYYRQYSKQYYQVNKEKKKEYDKQYGEANKEKKKEYNKQYYEENKEQAKQQMKEYYEKNKEQIKQQVKEYYETNKEKKKEYYEANKEKVKQQMKEYYEENKEKRKEKVKEYNKQYYEAHKEELKEKRKQRNKKSMKNALFN